MSNRLETAIKASAAEARLTKQKVLKELKQRMEGLIQQIENDRGSERTEATDGGTDSADRK